MSIVFVDDGGALVRLGWTLVFDVEDDAGGVEDAGDSDCVGDAVLLRFREVVAEVEGDNEGVEGDSGSTGSTRRDRNERELRVCVALMLDRVRFLILSGESSSLAALFLCADACWLLPLVLLELLALCDKSIALLRLLTLLKSGTLSFSVVVVVEGADGAGKGGAVYPGGSP